MTPVVDTVVQEDLVRLLGQGSVCVLSGAGLSTASGIPDYRGPTGLRRGTTPMTYQEFTGSVAARQRYWARSHAGWRAFSGVRPNAGHHAVAALQQVGAVDAVLTQNVDRLHQAAGTTGVVDLHGRLDRVVCLGCGVRIDRAEHLHRLEEANPGFAAVGAGHRVNPDGDVELPDDVVRDFRVVDCPRCGGGPLKPDVVFFGENVPRDRVQRCFAAVDAASALLVLGSSLTVMSGYRFVRHAVRSGTPVAIVNQGPTRGDDAATVRVDAPLERLLPDLLTALLG